MKLLLTTSFSETGAKILAKLLTTKYNCTIIDNSKFDEKRGMWITTYYDPTLGKDDENEISKIQRNTKKNKNRRT